MANRQKDCGVKIRSSEKDQLIAELRPQLYDLRSQTRDYRGINDEIFNMENRYRMLSDDKARGEHEARLRLDRGCDEIADARRALEELKFLIAEKTKIGCNLMDELQRAKRCLDEKSYEAARLKEEVVAKTDLVAHDHAALNAVMADIESVKVQRAEMWREIQRLKEICDKKTCES